MTQDYKYLTNSKRSTRQVGAPIWRWFLAALVIGIFTTFLVFLRSQKPAENNAVMGAVEQTPVKSMEKTQTGVAIPEKPRFEFYTILPEFEVEIPETEIKIRKREEKRGKAGPGQYLLQVGSFRIYKDADKLKAKLAMLGIESTIETAKVEDTTWNRVKLGPYRSLNAVDRIRTKLRQNQIDAIIVSAKK
jgi:cell division protein FtsN